MSSNSTDVDNKKSTFPLLRSSKLDSLRPSIFQSNTSSTPSNNGEEKKEMQLDNKLNPFLKFTESEDDQKPKTNDPEEKLDPLAALAKNGLGNSNLFKTAQAPKIIENAGFVFGVNVHERVTGDKLASDTQPSEETGKLNDGTSSGLLFSNAVQKAPAVNAQTKETPIKSLEDVAREYEESRAQKRKYDEVETVTGEEDEINVIDVNCKLFAFVASTYEERGRGSLRLNDAKKVKDGSSRVVFRTSGNLRVLLNTKVWSGMVAEQPSQKSLRLTAMDSNGDIKVFLAMARPDDIKMLYSYLNARIETEKLRNPTGENVASPSKSNHGAQDDGCTKDLSDDDDEPAHKKQLKDT